MLKKWNRLGATVIDFSIIIIMTRITFAFLYLIPGNLLVIRGSGTPLDFIHDISVMLFSLVWAVFIAVLYSVLTTVKLKNTFGRMVLKVHVLSNKTTENKVVYPEVKDLIKRELYKWTLIYSTMYIYAFYVAISIVIGRKDFLYSKISNTTVEVWV